MASEKVQNFIDALAPQAIEIGQEYNIDPLLILSQGALESGWGGSTSGNNVFGVKSHGQPGGQTILTHEEINGRMVPVYDSFRVYDSPAESMRDYAKFLSDNPRYKDVFGKPTESAIDAVAAAGYATDSEYANKLKAIANMIDLTPYRSSGNTSPTALAYNARLPQIGPTGGPALAAINRAAPQKTRSPLGSLIGFVKNAAPPIMQAAKSSVPQMKQGFANHLLGTVAGRTAIMRALLPSNIGNAPSVMQGHTGAGTQAYAVSPSGTAPVTLMRAANSPSPSFDTQYHQGQNMDIYRANRDQIGGPIMQSSINNAQSSGKTLYRL